MQRAKGWQVGVSIQLSTAIAEFVNDFHKAQRVEEDAVDALNLHESDISTLLEIAMFLASQPLAAPGTEGLN